MAMTPPSRDINTFFENVPPPRLRRGMNAMTSQNGVFVERDASPGISRQKCLEHGVRMDVPGGSQWGFLAPPRRLNNVPVDTAQGYCVRSVVMDSKPVGCRKSLIPVFCTTTHQPKQGHVSQDRLKIGYAVRRKYKIGLIFTIFSHERANQMYQVEDNLLPIISRR